MKKAPLPPIYGRVQRPEQPQLPDPVWAFEGGRLATAVGTGSRETIEAWCRWLACPEGARPKLRPLALAAVVVEAEQLVVHWTGDARVYHLDGQTLRLLTFEEVPYLPEEMGPAVRTLRVEAPGPGVFLAMTKGAWECWAAEWLLERALVRSFDKAADWDAWASLFTEQLAAVSRAGGTFAAIPWPVESYKSLRGGLQGGPEGRRFCEKVELDSRGTFDATLLVDWTRDTGAETQPIVVLGPALEATQKRDGAKPRQEKKRAGWLWRVAIGACILALTAGIARLTRDEGARTEHRPVTQQTRYSHGGTASAPTWTSPRLPAQAPPILSLPARVVAVRMSQAPAAPAVDAAPRPVAARIAPPKLRPPMVRVLRPAAVATARAPYKQLDFPAVIARSVASEGSQQRRAVEAERRRFLYVSRVHVVMRTGPGQAHTKRGVIPPGTTVEAMGRHRGGYWVKVAWAGRNGWIAPIRGYLRPEGQFSLWDIPPI